MKVGSDERMSVDLVVGLLDVGGWTGSSQDEAGEFVPEEVRQQVRRV